jgi:hypothetical protein
VGLVTASWHSTSLRVVVSGTWGDVLWMALGDYGHGKGCFMGCSLD